MPDRKKQRKREVQKIEYLENKRNFFVKIESIFHNLLSAFFGKIYQNGRRKL